MPFSSDSGADVVLPFVAAATEAATANVLFVTATSLIARLVMTTATSGNSYAAKVGGLVTGCTKSSATAFLTGAPIQITTGLICLATTAGAITNAYCAAYAGTTTTSIDVILRAPIAAGG